MSWLGKALGGAFGFVMGGPLGAALGVALGHQFDQAEPAIQFEDIGESPEEIESLRHDFFVSVFQMMGYLAKADGRVSESEIRCARDIMDRMRLDEGARYLAMRLFSEGKSDRFAIDSSIEMLRRSCGHHTHLFRVFVSLQLELALADGSINRQEEAALLQICDQLGFSRYELYGIKARLETGRRFGGFHDHDQRNKRSRGKFWEGDHQSWESKRGSIDTSSDIQEAYDVLHLRATASEDEIKKAYRRLISRHHPDKLVSKGQDQDLESVQKATERTQQIQKAYNLICKARRF